MTIGAGLACLMLAACGGGGGGGGSTGTATPSTPAPVTTTPTVPATPTSTTLVARDPSVVFASSSGAPVINTPQGFGSSVTVTLTDSKGRGDDFEVDENVSIRVQFTGPAGTVDRSFTAADNKGYMARSFQLAGSSATTANELVAFWETTGAAGDLSRYLVHIFNVRGGRDYVALTETQYTVNGVRSSAYQPVGVVTPVAQMPVTGTASYAGQMTGRFYDGLYDNLEGAEFLGSMTANANFATKALTGQGVVTGYRSGSTQNVGMTIAFNGVISTNGFAGSTTVSAVRPSTTLTGSGTFQGGFYGVGANAAGEIGGVFNGAFPNGYQVVGGFVAGQ